MKRLVCATPVVCACIHSALREATRPQLSLTAKRDATFGVIGELDIRNPTADPLILQEGSFSANASGPSHSGLHSGLPSLSAVAKLRQLLRRSSTNHLCFEELGEFSWSDFVLTLAPHEGRRIALVRFGFADSPQELLAKAKSISEHMDLKFHIQCKPLPWLPQYVISHEIALSGIDMREI